MSTYQNRPPPPDLLRTEWGRGATPEILILWVWRRAQDLVFLTSSEVMSPCRHCRPWGAPREQHCLSPLPGGPFPAGGAAVVDRSLSCSASSFHLGHWPGPPSTAHSPSPLPVSLSLTGLRQFGGWFSYLCFPGRGGGKLPVSLRRDPAQLQTKVVVTVSGWRGAPALGRTLRLECGSSEPDLKLEFPDLYLEAGAPSRGQGKSNPIFTTCVHRLVYLMAVLTAPLATATRPAPEPLGIHPGIPPPGRLLPKMHGPHT